MSLPTRLVVIGASAGGFRALGRVVDALPADLSAAVAIVLHLDPHHRSHLAELLARHAHLEVKSAEEGEVIRSGTVYVAPPDRHLVIDERGVIALQQTDKIRFLRPSADRLFESAARGWGPRTIAVVLTGTGNDGAAGLRAVKHAGGTTIAEDERSAEFPGMPQAAIATGSVDFVLPLDEIAGRIASLVTSERRE